MLLPLVDEPFDREGWLFEIKWDGFRAVAQISRDRGKGDGEKSARLNVPPEQPAQFFHHARGSGGNHMRADESDLRIY
jgi:hypothetical protein